MGVEEELCDPAEEERLGSGQPQMFREVHFTFWQPVVVGRLTFGPLYT